MSNCGCQVQPPSAPGERRVLRIALLLNLSMAIIGSAGGWMARSTGLLADALDMLSDAIAYGIALAAIGRAASFKSNAATLSGAILLMLGIAVLAEVVRRALQGSEPLGAAMAVLASLSLAVNLTVLRLLRPFRHGEVHLRATWMFTRADVVANAGVIVAAILVLLTGSRVPDLVIGAAIGCLVVKEALEILRQARASRRQQPASGA